VIISRGAAEDAEPSVVLGVDYRIAFSPWPRSRRRSCGWMSAH